MQDEQSGRGNSLRQKLAWLDLRGKGSLREGDRSYGAWGLVAFAGAILRSLCRVQTHDLS